MIQAEGVILDGPCVLFDISRVTIGISDAAKGRIYLTREILEADEARTLQRASFTCRLNNSPTLEVWR